MAKSRNELKNECGYKLTLAQAKADEWCRIFNMNKKTDYSHMYERADGTLARSPKNHCEDASREAIKIIEECQARLQK